MIIGRKLMNVVHHRIIIALKCDFDIVLNFRSLFIDVVIYSTYHLNVKVRVALLMLNLKKMWLLRTLPRQSNTNPIHNLSNHDLPILGTKTSLGAQENL